MQLLAILRKTVINVCVCTYEELLSVAKKPSINYNKESTTKYMNPLIRKLTNCSYTQLPLFKPFTVPILAATVSFLKVFCVFVLL